MTAASRAVILSFGAALVLTGVALAGYAIMLTLTPWFGAAGSAAATAAALLVLPLVFLAAGGMRAISARSPVASQINPETAVLRTLANVARDRPLLAVIGAGLFGAADVVLRSPGRSPRPRGTAGQTQRSAW
jgi:hypothetical protein